LVLVNLVSAVGVLVLSVRKWIYQRRKTVMDDRIQGMSQAILKINHSLICMKNNGRDMYGQNNF